MFWISHHRLFRMLARADLILVWLNLLMLFGIAMQPITTNLPGGFERPLVMLYAVNLGFVSTVLFSLWAYALVGRRLTDPAISTRYVRLVLLRAAVAPIVFLLSIPICLLSITVAILTWLLPLTLSVSMVHDTAPMIERKRLETPAVYREDRRG